MARKFTKSARKKSSMTPLRWAVLGCGSTVLLGLLTLAVLYLLATSTPPPPREAARPSPTTPAPTSGGRPAPPTTTAPSAQATPPLQNQLRQAREAGRSSQPTPIQLVITQGELNANLASQTQRGEIRNAQVYFGTGTVVATGDVQWQGGTVHVTVRAHPVVSGGKVRLIVDDVAIGRLPAPGVLRQQAQSRLDSAVEDLLRKQRFQAESLRVAPGVMTIEGSAGGRG